MYCSGLWAGHVSVVILLLSLSFAWGQAIVASHTCTDIEEVPADFIGKSKALHKVAYGFDPDGRINFMASNADDGCNCHANGVSGNWANEWLAKSPAHEIALPDTATHTEPLNASLTGRAFAMPRIQHIARSAR